MTRSPSYEIFDITSSPLFAATMSRDRFRDISQDLRFDDALGRDAEKRKRGKFAPLLKVWEAVESRLQRCFKSGFNITVDERMVGVYGPCSFKTHNPTKPDPQGVEMNCLVDGKAGVRFASEPHISTQKGAHPEWSHVAGGCGGYAVTFRLMEHVPGPLGRMPTLDEEGMPVMDDEGNPEEHLVNKNKELHVITSDRKFTSLGLYQVGDVTLTTLYYYFHC